MAQWIPTLFTEEAIPYNDGAARAAGEIFQFIDGRAAVVAGLVGAAAGDEYGVVLCGAGEAACGSGVTASAGDRAFWDDTAKTVVVADAQGFAPSNAFYLGLFADDKTSGQTKAQILLNAQPKTVEFAVTYASGTWAIKTGLTTILSYRVTIRRSGVQLATNPTLSVSGGTLTIASTSGGYTVTASDVAVVTVTGIGV